MKKLKGLLLGKPIEIEAETQDQLQFILNLISTWFSPTNDYSIRLCEKSYRNTETS